MARGVTLVDPDTVYLNGRHLEIHPDTIIEPHVTLNGPISSNRMSALVLVVT